MAERLLHTVSDGDLEAALRGLAPAIAWPGALAERDTDLAAAVRMQIESLPVPRTGLRAGIRWPWPAVGGPRSARRALVLALVALLAVAAVAGAVGLGLPGLRILFGEPPPGAVPTAVPSSAGATPPGPTVLGSSLRLGERLDPSDRPGLDDRAGFPVRLPQDDGVGPPESAWIDDSKGGQVTLVWPTSPDLPATEVPEVGLLVSQFRGTVDTGFFTKMIDSGTVVAPVAVGEHDGYWLSGEQHLFFWEGPDGFVDDGRRWVGDVLLWSDGEITYRVETSLGREAAIEIARSMD